MPESLSTAIAYALPFLTAALFAKSARSEWKKSELYPADAFGVFFAGIAAWSLSASSGTWAANAWPTLGCLAILFALVAQKTLNRTHFRLAAAGACFFGAYGESVAFLGLFLWTLVLRTVLGAAVFYARTLLSHKGRSTLRKYASDGIGKARWPEFWQAATVAALYVLALKATFAASVGAGKIPPEKILLFIGGLFVILPAIAKALETLLGKFRNAKILSVAVMAVLAAGFDVWTNGAAKAVPGLLAAFSAWMAAMATLAVLSRILKTYLLATKAELVSSGNFKAGDVLDADFFRARFPFAKNGEFFILPEWKASEEDVSAIRRHVAEFKKRHPSVPDEFRIFKKFPLMTYAFVSAVLVAIKIAVG